MHSVVFLLMLALCLMSLQCVASTEDAGLEHNAASQDSDAEGKPTPPKDPGTIPEQIEDPAQVDHPAEVEVPAAVDVSAGSGSTTTTAVPQQQAPQQTNTELEKPKLEMPQSKTVQSSGVQEEEDKGVNKVGSAKTSDKETTHPEPIPNPRNIQSPHGQTSKDQQSQQQQLQQQQLQQQQQQAQQQAQQHPSQPERTQDEVQTQERTGDALNNHNTLLKPTTTEKSTQTEALVPPPKGNKANAGQQTPNVHQQSSKNQGSTSSHTVENGRTKIQENPLTPSTLKKNGTAKDTTPPVDAAAPAQKDSVSAQKTAPISTEATPNAVNQTSLPNVNKEKIPAQTSTTSISEPANEESTSSMTSLPQLSKDTQFLDKKDSSIRSSLLFPFPALVMLVLMTVGPA